MKMMVRMLSSKVEFLTASWWALGAPASSDRTNRVPIQTADAPSIRAAASDCPLKRPPAATTWTWSPVMGLVFPLTISTTAGIKTVVGTSPVWPPPSPPWAQIMSAPTSRHFLTCLGWPIMFMYRTPAACNLSTTSLGGTPTAETKSLVPLSMMIVMSSLSLPFV